MRGRCVPSSPPPLPAPAAACDIPGVCRVTAAGCEKWWLHVNGARADCASVRQVVKESFIKHTQSHLWAASAGEGKKKKQKSVDAGKLLSCSHPLFVFSQLIAFLHLAIFLLSLALPLESSLQKLFFFFFWWAQLSCEFTSTLTSSNSCQI